MSLCIAAAVAVTDRARVHDMGQHHSGECCRGGEPDGGSPEPDPAQIQLWVQRPGRAELQVELSPAAPVLPSLQRALGREPGLELVGVWLGDSQLDGQRSWAAQGVRGGAAVRAVLAKVARVVTVADAGSHTLQMFRLDNGSWVRAIGSHGAGPGQFDSPTDLDYDQLGRLLVCDCGNRRVQILEPGSGNNRRQQLRDGCHLRSIQLAVGAPERLAVLPSRQLLVLDAERHCLQLLDPTDGRTEREVGQFGWKGGQLDHPCGLALDRRGNVLVADSFNHRVQQFRADDWDAQCGSVGQFGSAPGQFRYPSGVALQHASGNMVVVDTMNHRLQELSQNGTHVRTIGKRGSGPGEFEAPTAVVVDPVTGNLVVADRGNHRLQVLKSDGTFMHSMGSTGSGPGELHTPCGMKISREVL